VFGLWGVEEPVCVADDDEPGRDKLERVYDEMESFGTEFESGSVERDAGVENRGERTW